MLALQTRHHRLISMGPIVLLAPQALEAGPGNTKAQYRRAVGYQGLRRFDEASQDLEAPSLGNPG